ncbi:tryptophan-rich sensory protein [Portibacter lacus]|uniref:Tryptophan-rich sensory protein n=1 Tax=Portibacter lacus TaxID=1099794 RepID=A0AA37WDD3_9BACT|nr:tryptophan-rich sensory protein [Portibacter lacus]GLR15674.1 hypothetical protein GCM10007940_02890 [Portibacter lacus]
MNIYRLCAILNTICLAGVLTVNYLANALPINGINTGELSDLYPNVFVPAGLTFAIWGVIYLFLIGFVIYQFIKTDFDEIKEHHFISRISFFFVFNCLANITWILLWHHKMIFLSFLVMLIILITLIYIYQRLEVGKRHVRFSNKWLVHIPFSLYLGWITVATIANATTLLVSIGWDGFGLPESVWAMIMIFVATLVGFRVFAERKDVAYILVLIWAFIGIVIKRSEISGYQDTVAMAAIAGIVLLLITIIWGVFQKKKV